MLMFLRDCMLMATATLLHLYLLLIARTCFDNTTRQHHRQNQQCHQQAQPCPFFQHYYTLSLLHDIKLVNTLFKEQELTRMLILNLQGEEK